MNIHTYTSIIHIHTDTHIIIPSISDVDVDVEFNSMSLSWSLMIWEDNWAWFRYDCSSSFNALGLFVYHEPACVASRVEVELDVQVVLVDEFMLEVLNYYECVLIVVVSIYI